MKNEGELGYRVDDTLKKLKENGIAGECASIEALQEVATLLLIATFTGAKFNTKEAPGRIDVTKFYRHNILTGDFIRVLIQMILGIDDVAPGVKSMAIARRYLPPNHEMWERLKVYDPDAFEDIKNKYLGLLWASKELSTVI